MSTTKMGISFQQTKLFLVCMTCLLTHNALASGNSWKVDIQTPKPQTPELSIWPNVNLLSLISLCTGLKCESVQLYILCRITKKWYACVTISVRYIALCNVNKQCTINSNIFYLFNLMNNKSKFSGSIHRSTSVEYIL